MVTISVCMIVRDEEKNLASCLRAIRHLVDEIIVVDTGSKDKTKVIAQQFTDKVFTYQWRDDFAAARNYSIQQAIGDWILILDADESISAQDFVRIKKAIQSTSAVGFLFTTRNYTNDSVAVGWKNRGSDSYQESKVATGWWEVPNLRLFRRLPAVIFQGRVHENVLASIQELGDIESLSVVVHHYGKLDEKRESLKKELYQDLTKKKAQEQPDYYTYFELGRQYVQDGRLDEAIVALEQSLELQDYFESWYLLGSVYLLQEKYDLAKSALKRSLALHHSFSPTYTNLGILSAQQGQHKQAVEHYFTALLLEPKDATIYKNLGVSFDAMGDKTRALFALKQAVNLNPTYAKHITFQSEK